MFASRLITLFCIVAAASADADHFLIHSFQSQQLTGTYFSEGANAGDVNGDGVADVIYGPYWFAGPDYTAKQEIYKPVPQDMNRYADNFFSWVHDFNGDGYSDVLVVGFPGTPAYVYENPRKNGLDAHWKKHQVFDWVSNESPQLVDMFGDDRPELVCTRDGFFGFATIDKDDPFGHWSNSIRYPSKSRLKSLGMAWESAMSMATVGWTSFTLVAGTNNRLPMPTPLDGDIIK